MSKEALEVEEWQFLLGSLRTRPEIRIWIHIIFLESLGRD
jgi:hypothetical protein